MRKNKFKIVLILVISAYMMGCANVFAINSSYNIEHEIEIDSIPKAAVNANINAWIIVAGDRESDHELYYCIEDGCTEVYNILLGLGYSADNLYFMADDWDGSLPGIAKNTSERVNIQWAIESWASNKVSSSLGLGIFLFDHGGYNSMSLPGPNLGDTHLNSYLDTLEAATGMTRSVIVYEACHAGSFIDPVSKDNRIVVCATDSAHSSYPTADLSTAVFTEAFWSSISVGYSIGEAFENAKANVDAAGLGPYQKPWIDDNHDEIGHTVDPWGHLPYFGDGNDALNLHIKPPLVIGPWLFLLAPLPIYIKPDIRILPISIMVKNNDTTIDYVRAYIRPPDWQPPIPVIDPDDPWDPEIPYIPGAEFADSFFDVFFTLTESSFGTHNYTAIVNIPGLIKQFGGISEGELEVTFKAKTESSVVSPIVPSLITINEEGEAPTDITPPTVIITNPNPNNELSNEINITVQGDDDQALDTIQILLDGAPLNTTNMPSYLPYPEVVYSLNTGLHVNGLHNITAIAIDESGNQEQTTVLVNFQNNVLLNFDYQPYLIGAVVGVGLGAVGQLLVKRKRK
ncbi:MAG: hypothetical protein GY870_21835 [archaeon]|nr:hypothetical protein [archaeon]